MQDIVIAGVGSTKFGKLENLSATELATTAALQAIDEANFEVAEIGQFIWVTLFLAF